MYRLALLPLLFAAVSAGIIAAPVHHQPQVAVVTRPGTFATSHSSVYQYGVSTPVAIPVHGDAPAPVVHAPVFHAAPAPANAPHAPVVYAAPAPTVLAAPAPAPEHALHAPAVHPAPAPIVLAAPVQAHAPHAPVVYAAPAPAPVHAPHTAVVTRPATFSTSHSSVYQYGVVTPVAVPVAHHAPAPAPAPLLLTHAAHGLVH